MTDLLPDSRLRTITTPKHAQWRLGAFWVPIYCASCGTQGGMVPQENISIASWICDPCYAKHGDILGGLVTPDEVFFARVEAEQREKYGRPLTAVETVVSLSDPESMESRLARDRAALTPSAGD